MADVRGSFSLGLMSTAAVENTTSQCTAFARLCDPPPHSTQQRHSQWSLPVRLIHRAGCWCVRHNSTRLQLFNASLQARGKSSGRLINPALPSWPRCSRAAISARGRISQRILDLIL